VARDARMSQPLCRYQTTMSLAPRGDRDAAAGSPERTATVMLPDRDYFGVNRAVVRSTQAAAKVPVSSGRTFGHRA